VSIVGDRASAAVALRSSLRGTVDVSSRRRAEFSSDASNYRVPPAAVFFPADEDDVVGIVEAARSEGIVVTGRGGGTSVAGNAVGPGWVVDFSRHLGGVLDIDSTERTARVLPGTVLGALQRAAAPRGLRFGPDPSTQARATIGGMIGNDACGPRAVRWGRTSDNVRTLRLVDGTGRLVELSTGFEPYPELEDLTRRNLALFRTELGRFGRQVSGFGLERLLPERGRRLAQAISGTEGTTGLVVEATVDLVPLPAATTLVVLGYPDMASAADDAPLLLPRRPVAVESMDSYLVDVVRARSATGSVPELPRGGAWLFVETDGANVAESIAAAREIAAASSALDARVVGDLEEARALWRLREDGVGLAGRTVDGDPAWPGWEDAAVPPERLGDYLRAFDELKASHGVHGLSYGHVGDGCIHTRLDLPIADAPERFAAFIEASADLVVSFGGSLSGEHGDGRARSALLPRMYSDEMLRAFADFKRVFDPDGILNPGIVVDPGPIDESLRLVAARPFASPGFALLEDRGDFTRAVHRCVGVGKCRADNSAAGGFMCPSYLATRDEKDSTRGRARVLQEMVNGTLVRAGWDAPEVAESLDLCLSCKACSSDCPAGVDMAAYKSTALHARYRRRIRPMSHYTLGRLPAWLRLASIAPRVVNLVAAIAPLRRLGLRLAGADPRRGIPALPPRTYRRILRRARRGAAGRPKVVLWLDSFTNSFSPSVAAAATSLLEGLGYEVVLTPRQECCGLTWISTGQLDRARELLRSSLTALEPLLTEPGVHLIGLEPSCASVLRSDVRELLPDDPRSALVAARVRTLAEFLAQDHPVPWSPPDLSELEIVAQPHCHHHAVFGWDADRQLLESAGARITTIAGCCGLAGNFGMERGHYEVSVAVAENGMLPALRSAPGAVLLADGFSCRTQADQLAGRSGLHLAELLIRE